MPDDLVFLEHDRIISSVSMYIVTVDIQHTSAPMQSMPHGGTVNVSIEG